MEAKLIRERVAQYIKDRRFLNAYECPVCGREVLKSKQNASKGSRCGPCRNTTHGMKRHPLYNVWDSMRRRCLDTSHVSFHNYGGRGVSVCPEWSDVRNFIAWAESAGWSSGLEIDRIDVNGNYCPENCRFVTHRENMQNKRSTKLDPSKVLEIRSLVKDGKTKAEVARRFGVSSSTAHYVSTGVTWMNVTGLESASHSLQGE